MTKVTLYHPNGTVRTVSFGAGVESSMADKLIQKATDTAKAGRHHQKASFACMADLAPMLLFNVTADDVWEYLKHRFGQVSSRSEFSAEVWAIISAQLNNAKRSPSARADLSREVWEHRESIRKF